MRKRKGIVKALLCVVSAVFLLSGCGNSSYDSFESDLKQQLEEKEQKQNEEKAEADELYEKIRERTEESYYSAMDNLDNIEGESGTADAVIFSWGFAVYQKFKGFALPIIGISMVSGIVIAFIATENKKILRFAVVGLIIGIPVLVLAIVLGIPFLSTVI